MKDKGIDTVSMNAFKEFFQECKVKSWNKTIRGWATIQRELVQKYGERFTKHLR